LAESFDEYIYVDVILVGDVPVSEVCLFSLFVLFILFGLVWFICLFVYLFYLFFFSQRLSFIYLFISFYLKKRIRDLLDELIYDVEVTVIDTTPRPPVSNLTGLKFFSNVFLLLLCLFFFLSLYSL
jgi:hypothetical protein